MARIGFLGDTHGHANVVLAALKRFFADDVMTIIQVGDFGFKDDKHGRVFLTYVNTLLGKNGQKMYVVPGNHDDYTYLNRLPVRADGWQVATSNILVAPRGHRWNWDGRSFVALGGAPSINRTALLQGQRMYGIPMWWPEEAITGEDIMKTIAGGRADIMVAHDAPEGVPQIRKVIANSRITVLNDDGEYANQGRRDMLTVVDVVRPEIFFHGHYHRKIDDKLEIFNEDTGLDDVVNIKGLAHNGELYSQGVLNTETMKFTFWYGQGYDR